jgi:hypothetical protein
MMGFFQLVAARKFGEVADLALPTSTPSSLAKIEHVREWVENGFFPLRFFHSASDCRPLSVLAKTALLGLNLIFGFILN